MSSFSSLIDPNFLYRILDSKKNTMSSNKTIEEPCIALNHNRFVLFPIQEKTLWKLYKDAVSTFWTPEEIDFSKDREDWDNLTDGERHFIEHVLAFFAGSDGIIMENLAARFLNEVQLPEARAFYSYQIFNENVHSETYSILLDTYIRDESHRNNLLCAIQTVPVIHDKAQWAIDWIQNQTAPFAQRILAFSFVEGIFFSGSFCAIYWLKNRKYILPGLAFSNELIAKDEGIHTEFAIKLYHLCQNKLKPEIVYKMIDGAVSIEKRFIMDALPCSLIGMNAELMGTYIEYVADRLLVQLGYEKRWNAQNPFDFMEMISLRPKSNFFEVRVGEYKKAEVEQVKWSSHAEEDF